jgi:copper(I)-binding protein
MLIDTAQATIRRLRRQAWLCGLVLILVTPNASALFIVNQPWARPARSGQSTEVYMNLTSTNGATLLGARSEDAGRVSLHSAHSAAAAGMALPARSEVSLAPGHDYLTLTRLTRALKIGDWVRLTLTVRDGDGSVHEIPVNAEVRVRSPVDDERRADHLR